MTSEASDDAPRPKPQRPRDELGRPLPAGSANRLQLEDFDALSLEQNHRLAARYFDEQQFFGAHEAWETCWNQAKGTADEEFFKGLSQLGAGYTHYLRGNARGAGALLRRGIGRVTDHGPRHHGLDISALAAAVEAALERIDAVERSGGALPPLEPPQLGPILDM